VNKKLMNIFRNGPMNDWLGIRSSLETCQTSSLRRIGFGCRSWLSWTG